MAIKPDETVAAQFEALISDPKKTENHVQAFLEEHTEFIYPAWKMNHPLNMNSVISKFPIGGRTADFAYLTSSSAKWNLVLVELESPNKRIFTNSSEHNKTSSAFDDALHQTHVWAEYFEDHQEEVRRTLRPLLVPPAKAHNRVSLRRVLVIGRSAELDHYEGRRRRIASIGEAHDMEILTYDSLLRYYRSGLGKKRCVLSPRSDCFAIKRMDGIPENTFAYVMPEHLDIPAKFEAELEALGYQMAEWRANMPLMFNDKWAIRPSGDQDYIDGTLGRVSTPRLRASKRVAGSAAEPRNRPFRADGVSISDAIVPRDEHFQRCSRRRCSAQQSLAGGRTRFCALLRAAGDCFGGAGRAERLRVRTARRMGLGQILRAQLRAKLFRKMVPGMPK